MLFFKLLTFLLILLFPFGQLTRLPVFFSPQVHVYLSDLTLLVLIISWLFYHLFRQKTPFRPPLLKPILLFAGVALFSLLVNFSRLSLGEFLISSLYLLRWLAYAGVYFLIYTFVKTKPSSAKILIRLLILGGVLIAVFGLLQYFFYPKLRNLYYLGWDPHENRLFGTFFDPNFTGVILVLTLILITIFAFDKSAHLFNFVNGAWVITYLSLMFTYSRSSYLAYLTAMLTIGVIKKSWKFIAAILIIFTITLLLLPRPPGEGVKLERTSTINARFANYQQILTIIKDHALFGVGFNSLRYAKRDYGFLDKETWQETHSAAGADSSFLFIWATTGIFGLISYLWLWWKILTIEPSSNHPPAGETGQTTAMILPISVALLTHSLFLNSLFYPWIMFWFWLVLGISHASFKHGLVSRGIRG